MRAEVYIHHCVIVAMDVQYIKVNQIMQAVRRDPYNYLPNDHGLGMGYLHETQIIITTII